MTWRLRPCRNLVLSFQTENHRTGPSVRPVRYLTHTHTHTIHGIILFLPPSLSLSLSLSFSHTHTPVAVIAPALLQLCPQLSAHYHAVNLMMDVIPQQQPAQATCAETEPEPEPSLARTRAAGERPALFIISQVFSDK